MIPSYFGNYKQMISNNTDTVCSKNSCKKCKIMNLKYTMMWGKKIKIFNINLSSK